jgi:hypothetical protein
VREGRDCRADVPLLGWEKVYELMPSGRCVRDEDETEAPDRRKIEIEEAGRRPFKGLPGEKATLPTRS